MALTEALFRAANALGNTAESLGRLGTSAGRAADSPAAGRKFLTFTAQQIDFLRSQALAMSQVEPFGVVLSRAREGQLGVAESLIAAGTPGAAVVRTRLALDQVSQRRQRSVAEDLIAAGQSRRSRVRNPLSVAEEIIMSRVSVAEELIAARRRS
jgi:hypothetical protein